MADIKAIKGTNGTTYSIVDRFSKWGGNNLILNVPRSYVSANYDAYSLNLSENLVAGEVYTLQLWDVSIAHSGKTEAQLGPSIYWGGGYINLCSFMGTNYITNGTAAYLKATFTPSYSTSNTNQVNDAKNPWLVIYNSPGNASGTRSMSIGKWKLEKGHKATDWSPCWADIFTYGSDTINVNI